MGLGNQATGTVKGAHGDDSLKKAEADLLLLIQRWANGTSTDDLFDSINNIYRDADQDPELKSWFKNINAYVRKCLKQQGYILEDAATEEWNALYDRGNFLLRDRYRNHTDRVVDEVKFLADQFDKDPVNKRFAESIQKLFNDLGNDENGKPTFKPHLVKDLTDVIIPGVFESVRYVPVPRIEYSDPMMDAVIENLVIESDNLMPNVLEIANDNYFRWGRKKVAKVDVDVKNFNIKLKQSKHKVLFAIGKPMMLKVMRPALQKALEKVIKDKFNEFDAMAYKVKVEADRAIEEAKEDPENAPNIYQRYVNAPQKQILQGKQKAEAVAADKKVNVAMTQHDSIFPNIKLPGGISSKATEYKELGQKGDTWHSPIFKLGSASASTDVPKAPNVTRKEHSVTSGGVRGPQNVGNTGSTTNQLHDPSAQAAGTSTGSSFGNQVDQALNPSVNGSGINSSGINSSTTNGNGYTNGKVANGNTTLGQNNPVLSGSV